MDTSCCRCGSPNTFLIDRSADGLQGDLFLLDLTEHASRSRSTLGDTGRNIFRSLCTTGDIYTFGHRGDRIQLGVALDEPAICSCRKCQTSWPTAFASCRGSKPAGQDDHIHRDTALLANQCILHLDDQLAFFTGHCGRHRSSLPLRRG